MNETGWVHKQTEVKRTTVTNVGLNMFCYNERFRQIRTKDRGCKLCRKPFVDNQYVHIASTDRGNKLLCDSCAKKAIDGGASFFNRKENPHDPI